jgi:hypothetical protein
MMKLIQFSVLLLVSSFSFANIYIYQGIFDNKKIYLYIDDTSDTNITTLYLYDNSPPISLDLLKKDNEWTFREGNCVLKTSCNYLIVNNIELDPDDESLKNKVLTGYWTNDATYKKYPLNLNKIKELKLLDSEIEFDNELIWQDDTLKEFYFAVLLTKKKNELPIITGINIYSKNGGNLIQKIEHLNNDFIYLFNSISTGDYNFDGIEDFSIFKSGSRNWLFSKNIYSYYIYDNQKNKFVNIPLEEPNIIFDPKNQTATSQKDCVEYLESDIGRKITTIKKVYHYQNKQFIYSPTEDSCLIYFEYDHQSDSSFNCDAESYSKCISE